MSDEIVVTRKMMEDKFNNIIKELLYIQYINEIILLICFNLVILNFNNIVTNIIIISIIILLYLCCRKKIKYFKSLM